MDRPIGIDDGGDLEPRAQTVMIDGEPETVLNVDGVISLAKHGDSERSREAYRHYRKLRAQLRVADPDRDDADIRREAIISALAAIGAHFVEVKP